MSLRARSIRCRQHNGRCHKHPMRKVGRIPVNRRAPAYVLYQATVTSNASNGPFIGVL